MVSMGLPDVRKFPFIEPPPIESLEESVMVLKAQDALNPDEVCITKYLLHTHLSNKRRGWNKRGLIDKKSPPLLV